jgi:hypothetical protein
VGASHEGGHLLVPHLHEFNLVLCALQGAEHPIDAVARIAEDPAHAPFIQPMHEEIADGVAHNDKLSMERGRRARVAQITGATGASFQQRSPEDIQIMPLSSYASRRSRYWATTLV